MQITEETKLRILEESQSSSWGHISIRDAIGIARELLKQHSYVYIYSKWTNNVKSKRGRTHLEGWATIRGFETPTFYCMIGARTAAEGAVMTFETMRSTTGLKKQSTPPPMTYWTLWNNFRLMFGDEYVTVDQGRVECNNREELARLVCEWESHLSTVDGRPMLTVLRHYSVNDFNALMSMRKGELLQEIATLRKWLTTKDDEVTMGKVPLIAKGLSGSVVSMRQRLTMRIKFWDEVAKNGGDVWNLAKTYSVTRPDWAENLKPTRGGFVVNG